MKSLSYFLVWQKRKLSDKPVEAGDDYTKFNSADFARKVSVILRRLPEKTKQLLVESVALISLSFDYIIMTFGHVFAFISEVCFLSLLKTLSDCQRSCCWLNTFFKLCLYTHGSEGLTLLTFSA